MMIYDVRTCASDHVYISYTTTIITTPALLTPSKHNRERLLAILFALYCNYQRHYKAKGINLNFILLLETSRDKSFEINFKLLQQVKTKRQRQENT